MEITWNWHHFLRRKGRRGPVNISSKNVVVCCKLSASKYRGNGNYVKLPLFPPASSWTLKSAKNIAKNLMNISGENVEIKWNCYHFLQWKVVVVSWTSRPPYVKDMDVNPMSISGETCRRRESHGNYVKSPTRLFCIEMSIPWRVIWCSSGLFRTLYSIAKSEGKSGSSENKQGKGNER